MTLWKRETQQRQARFNKGLRGIIDRVTGRHRRIKKQNERDAWQASRRNQYEKGQLIFTQLEQRRGFQSRIERLQDFRQTHAQDLTEDITQYRDISQQKRDLFELRKH